MNDGEDIVEAIGRWLMVPVAGTAQGIMEKAAREIVVLRTLLANRWMADDHGDSQPRQNHRRPDQR